ncbi:MAG: bifunctional adenosylcobinamide kinase/adenosylcobinamide-phosphate guanylyltransferase [Pseudobacteriovorax sp.]|nr:bifunctional adenosylcobinamide kinase/adenosylcobinamide-phosphate guanylyltransferase [Pseudobacteriovorax sp.]
MTSSPIKFSNNMSHCLILGGAYAGKSDFLSTFLEHDYAVTILGTSHQNAEPLTRRVDDLKEKRPSHWLSIDTPLDLETELSSRIDSDHIIIIDSLSQWLANVIVSRIGKYSSSQMEESIRLECHHILQQIKKRKKATVVVSSDFSQSMPPEDPMARLLRSENGLLNQQLAALCPQIILMTAGIPQYLKS